MELRDEALGMAHDHVEVSVAVAREARVGEREAVAGVRGERERAVDPVAGEEQVEVAEAALDRALVHGATERGPLQDERLEPAGAQRREEARELAVLPLGTRAERGERRAQVVAGLGRERLEGGVPREGRESEPRHPVSVGEVAERRAETIVGEEREVALREGRRRSPARPQQERVDGRERRLRRTHEPTFRGPSSARSSAVRRAPSRSRSWTGASARSAAAMLSQSASTVADSGASTRASPRSARRAARKGWSDMRGSGTRSARTRSSRTFVQVL